MSLLRTLARLSSGPGYRKFLQATRDPERAQAAVWAEILREISGAPYWRGRLRADSRLRDLPISRYEDYRAAIERSFQTGVSELSGKRVMYWSESSGTSGKRKLFPITPLYRAQFQRTTPPYLHGLIRRFPGFLQEKVLYFAGMNPSEKSPTGLDVGFISNFNYRHIPRLLQGGYGFPPELFRDWASFEKWAPVYALANDLSAMIAITPSVLSQFAGRIEKNREFCLDALKGKVALPPGFPEPRASRQRLDRLASALSGARGRISFRELWPSLQFVSCWKSSGCALQMPELQSYCDLPVVDATYSATEGWVNVPLPEGCGGPVHPAAHVFEFCKVGEEPDPARLLGLGELEAGESYEIFLSTAMGLLRYRVFDVVRCTGHFERSPIIEFVQKSLNEIVLGMIRVSETQLLQALGCAGLALTDRWFIAPSRSGDGLVFFTLSTQAPAKAPDAEAMAAIDREIRRLNKYYDRDIGRGLLKPIRAETLPEAHPAWQVSTHQQSKPLTIRRETP